MSIGTAEYVQQTYTPWVDVWVKQGAEEGGSASSFESLTRKEGKPYRLLSFEHTIKTSGKAGGGVSNWKLELFDEQWTEIESKLYEPVPEDAEGNEKRWIEFQYYYVGADGSRGMGEMASIVYSGKLVSCVPTFTAYGVQLSLEGIEMQGEANIRKSSARYVEGELVMSVPIHDIIKKIIKIHPNWKEGRIEPTESIMDSNHFWYSDPQHCYFNKEGPMSDQQFIKTVLAPRAVSLLTGKAGYRWYQEQGADGFVYCHFEPENLDPEDAHPGYAGEDPRIFHYIKGDKNTEVISFSPEIIGETLGSMMGNNKVTIIYTEPITKRTGKVEVDDKETPDKTLYNEKTMKHSDPQPGDNTLVVHHPVSSKKEAESLAKGWFYSQWVRNYQATLEIVGDPRLKPQQMVRVLVVLDDGTLHYTSGGYMVIEVTHSIAPGKWVTSAKLARGTAAKGYEATGNAANWTT